MSKIWCQNFLHISEILFRFSCWGIFT